MPTLTRFQRVTQIGGLILPIVGYTVGDYLVDHWALAKQLDELLKPYAFNASLLIGLVLGLAQLGWYYAKNRRLNSCLIQMLVHLLVFTLVPLAVGEKFHGHSTMGLLWELAAIVYLFDAVVQAPLFTAFPRHFAPQIADRLSDPHVRRVIVHIEYAYVAMSALEGAFMLFAHQYLPTGLYLVLLAYYSKALLTAFMAFSFFYPRWLKRRHERRLQAAALAQEGLAA